MYFLSVFGGKTHLKFNDFASEYVNSADISAILLFTAFWLANAAKIKHASYFCVFEFVGFVRLVLRGNDTDLDEEPKIRRYGFEESQFRT